jgi:hypothetical protein
VEHDLECLGSQLNGKAVHGPASVNDEYVFEEIWVHELFLLLFVVFFDLYLFAIFAFLNHLIHGIRIHVNLARVSLKEELISKLKRAQLREDGD